MWKMVTQVGHTYHELVLDYWYRMGPTEYGCMLILIGVCGYLMMKTASMR